MQIAYGLDIMFRLRFHFSDESGMCFLIKFFLFFSMQINKKKCECMCVFDIVHESKERMKMRKTEWLLLSCVYVFKKKNSIHAVRWISVSVILIFSVCISTKFVLFILRRRQWFSETDATFFARQIANKKRSCLKSAYFKSALFCVHFNEFWWITKKNCHQLASCTWCVSCTLYTSCVCLKICHLYKLF